ncbi:MAG: MarR family transcriptional regulator [Pseudomonadota bacterium]
MSARLRELLDRIARVTAAEEWSDDLNPAQRSALAYLARANRFSRAPSNVADYLCTTRGTASQTLKALERKGFIAKTPSPVDGRSISYEPTDLGHTALRAPSDLDTALSTIDAGDAERLSTVLDTTLRAVLQRRGHRSFGVCKTCRHHRMTRDGYHCALLDVALSGEQREELCHEHVAALDLAPGGVGG